MEIDNIRKKIKKKKPSKKYDLLFYINKFLFVVLLTIITLILSKTSTKFKSYLYKEVYQKNINFSYFNNLYNKKFGSVFLNNKTASVFDEKLTYDSKKKYLDGVELSVKDNYSVPAINDGMVIFVGEKEEYGKTVILESSDGIEIWYANLNSNLKIYDYVEKGSLIGEANGKFYLVFKKDNQVLNYEKYI